MILKIGTRGSRLALAQARIAQAAFAAVHIESELVVVHTRGDLDRVSPLSEIGRGAFTDVFSGMIARGELDVAVPWPKYLPPDEADDGFFCLPRADARDALLTVKGRRVVRIGTGSPRRAVTAALFAGARVLPVRGNVDTRIRKLKAGEYDALVLACAGLERLGFSDEEVEVTPLAPSVCVPAACQGIIAVEGAAGECIHAEETGRAARIERACQRLLGGGCTGGVGCYFDGVTLYAQKEGVIRSIPFGEGAAERLAEEFV